MVCRSQCLISNSRRPQTFCSTERRELQLQRMPFLMIVQLQQHPQKQSPSQNQSSNAQSQSRCWPFLATFLTRSKPTLRTASCTSWTRHLTHSRVTARIRRQQDKHLGRHKNIKIPTKWPRQCLCIFKLLLVDVLLKFLARFRKLFEMSKVASQGMCAETKKRQRTKMSRMRAPERTSSCELECRRCVRSGSNQDVQMSVV